MDTVKFGILGTRRGLAFAEAAAALSGVEIAALCGRDGERLRLMGERFGISKHYTAYDDMLNDRDRIGVP